MNLKNQWLDIKLRNKFLIPTVIIVVVGMGVSALITYIKAEQSIIKLQKSNLEQLSNTLSDQVNYFLKEIKVNTFHWSSDPMFKMAVANTFLGKSVRETANEKLKALKNDYSYIESFTLFGPTGKALASDNPIIPYNLIASEKPYFKKAMQGNSIISKVFESGMSGAPVFVVASPLKDFNNIIIGVFTATIRMEYFNTIIVEPIHPGKSGYAFVYDSNGIVIAHKDKFNILDLDMNTYAHGKEMLNNIEGYITYKDEDGTKFISYRNIKDTGWTIAVLSDKNDIINSINEIAYVSLALVSIVALLIGGLIFYIALSIVKPIEKVVEFTDSIARGDLGEKLTVQSNDEVGQLINSVNSILVNLKSIVSQAENIAQGDFEVDMPLLSDEDILTPALIQMAINLKEVTNLAHDVANGDLDGAIKIKGKKDVLSKSINIMVANLRASSKENELQRNYEKFNRELIKYITGDLSINDFARRVIEYLAENLDMQVASFYSFKNAKLIPVASYATEKIKTNLKEYFLGESLIGESAKRKKIIQIENIPKNYLQISSSLGKLSPNHLLIVPVIHNNELKAVFELGSFNKISEEKRLLLNNVLSIIGINVSVCQSREETNSLLIETQVQAESLQAQQEELKASNEELEEQTQLLRQSEDNLKLLNEELEDKTKSLEFQKQSVEVKNKEVEEKALELTAASKYKSEFLANMSHELRTPLNSLLILSKMLHDNKEGNLNNKQIEWARVISNSGTDLLELINDILDLSKIEAGKMSMDINHINISDIIASITDKFVHIANNKGIDFIVDNKLSETDHIKTDGQKLCQILKNLTSNAVKFTNKGQVTLSLYKPNFNTMLEYNNLDIKNTIAISVNDTGIGIAKDKLNEIFNAFQQEDGATSRKYGGTGLGLSISTELAHLLGGRITVESIQGKGSIFTLCLPLQYNFDNIDTFNNKGNDFKNNSQHISKLIPSIKIETFIDDDRNKYTRKKKSVVIIEDNKNFASSLLELVRTQNYIGLVAGNGKSGLSIIEKYKPTAILLDLGLPDMSGEEVLLHVKDNINLRHIPIHIISGHEKDRKYLKHGVIGFLEKPVNVQSIKKMFEKINSIVDGEVKTILLVEDNEESQIAISALLENDYTKIIVAKNVKTAMAILSSEKIDCLLLDLGLPDNSGVSFIYELKNKCISNCPVIIHTGRDLDDNEVWELNKIADSIIIKGSQSHDRLLDETMLFLHHLDSKLSISQRNIIGTLHDTEKTFNNKKILLVDDDMRNVFALSGLLSQHDMQVTMAENGQDALDKLNDNSDYDLILMDIMMPIMDGYEAMTAIRKNTKTKSIPIISLTAKAMPEDREKCINSGANDYLAKPIDTDKLLSLMRVWLH